ncbi:unnamed protein product [Mytilus edulis]|uniref:Uncharacterized protein n=1 Tax=Mytilus edulis TaxID=6550 RepID=A0A8S3UTU4_MYTED|nr:unnamed protein product [Mytilus edulis]
MTDVLNNGKIEKTIITEAEQQSFDNEADTYLKKPDTMSNQSDNNFDEQPEMIKEAEDRLKSTQHEIDMGMVYTKDEQTLETEANTNRNKMAKQSENNFDEQNEEAIEAVDLSESTQHELGIEFIYIKGRNDAETTTDNLQLKLERIGHHLLRGDQLMHFKELFPKHIKDERNICLSKLQKQLSVVYKCKNFINTIETSLESIMQQCHEEQVFRMVHISTKFFASTLKKAISDSEKIKLVFNPISVGGKDVMFDIGEEKRVIPQNLTALLAKKKTRRI